MKKLVVFLLSVILVTSVVEARSKKSQSTKKHGIVKKYKAKQSTKKVYSFTYDTIWFDSLTSKQQSFYLKTIAKLARQIEGGKYSFNHPIINSFLSPAFAGNQTLSNGYIYNKSEGDFRKFFDNKNFGELDPTCQGDQRPCAPYLGLVDGDPPVLACSPNQTKLCSQRGDIELLKRTRQRCKSNKLSESYCRKLEAEIGISIKRVGAWCGGQRTKGKVYCKAALRALTENDLFPPTNADKALKTGNCKRLADKMVKNANRPENSSTAYNNKFWRNMGEVAEQICPSEVTSRIPKVMGVCDASPASITYSRDVTYNKGESGFDNCQKGMISKIEETYNEEKEKLNSQIEKMQGAIAEYTLLGTPSNISAENQALITTRKDRLAVMKTRLSGLDSKKDKETKEMKEATECTTHQSVEGPIGDIAELEKYGILKKLKINTPLKNWEKSLFKRVTGLDPEGNNSDIKGFKYAFCESEETGKEGMKQFKAKLKNSLKTKPTIKAATLTGEERFQTQADNSYLRMEKCLDNLKTVEDVGCEFKNVSNSAETYLKRASEGKFILAQDKERPDKCALVLEYKKVVDEITLLDSDGQPQRDGRGDVMVEKREVDRLTVEETNPNNLSFVTSLDYKKAGKRYNIIAYTCTHVRQTGGDAEVAEDVFRSHQ